VHPQIRSLAPLFACLCQALIPDGRSDGRVRVAVPSIFRSGGLLEAEGRHGDAAQLERPAILDQLDHDERALERGTERSSALSSVHDLVTQSRRGPNGRLRHTRFSYPATLAPISNPPIHRLLVDLQPT